ncbi:MAG: hypothetical protein M0Q22_10795 [Sulfuritalea sp.]|jgi:hypothetical protein|nr:hypothetical protein [Sulfuritalea sp.]
MRHEKIAPVTEKPARLGRADPLLQELWAIKAVLNAQAGYSVKKLAEQARQFDVDVALARLRQQH